MGIVRVHMSCVWRRCASSRSISTAQAHLCVHGEWLNGEGAEQPSSGLLKCFPGDLPIGCMNDTIIWKIGAYGLHNISLAGSDSQPSHAALSSATTTIIIVITIRNINKIIINIRKTTHSLRKAWISRTTTMSSAHAHTHITRAMPVCSALRVVYSGAHKRTSFHDSWTNNSYLCSARNHSLLRVPMCDVRVLCLVIHFCTAEFFAALFWKAGARAAIGMQRTILKWNENGHKSAQQTFEIL